MSSKSDLNIADDIAIVVQGLSKSYETAALVVDSSLREQFPLW